MELYLDSVKLEEIEAAINLGIVAGVTTTPTFMHREGIQNVDATIVELATRVPVIQIEALGRTAEEIITEAERQNNLGLSKSTTVYKIPMSLEGVKACRKLTNMGYRVNMHLVYTLQQAYMAMEAGADYVCPLVGRLQDQGGDAIGLVASAVEVVEKYGYNSKVMFSSVRNPQHIKDALKAGAHTITVPWGIMKTLADHHLTTIGIEQFFEHSKS
jgi:TalC/MipB family fructose-6-phosphate aldolase